MPPASRRRRRRTRDRWLTISLAALVVPVVALVAVVVTENSANSARNARAAGYVTNPAGWRLPALSGSRAITLAQFRGQPTVVNFFASWCTACDFELPGFAHVSQLLRGQVNFVGVNALETGDPMLMPRRHGITWWPLARDIGGANGSGLHDALGGGNSMPLTAFYDAQGRLLDVERGALPESALRAALQQLYHVPT